MSEEPDGWLRATPDGVVLRVHVAPRAARSGVAGFHGEALRVRIAAPPVEGAANRELVRFLARALGIGEAGVVVDAGEHARQKRVRVRGRARAAETRARTRSRAGRRPGPARPRALR